MENEIIFTFKVVFTAATNGQLSSSLVVITIIISTGCSPNDISYRGYFLVFISNRCNVDVRLCHD